jgi:hypothetical protein
MSLLNSKHFAGMALVELHQQQRPCKTHDGYSGIKN